MQTLHLAIWVPIHLTMIPNMMVKNCANILNDIEVMLAEWKVWISHDVKNLFQIKKRVTWSMTNANHTHIIAIFASLPGYGIDIGVVCVSRTPSFLEQTFLHHLFPYFLFVRFGWTYGCQILVTQFNTPSLTHLQNFGQNF